VLPLRARYPWGVAVERGGSTVKKGACAERRQWGKALRMHRIAGIGVESPLRRRGEVRGSCVTCGGAEEAIAEEGRALRVAGAWVASS
jgi:hypothetical protein